MGKFIFGGRAFPSKRAAQEHIDEAVKSEYEARGGGLSGRDGIAVSAGSGAYWCLSEILKIHPHRASKTGVGVAGFRIRPSLIGTKGAECLVRRLDGSVVDMTRKLDKLRGRPP